ncbi:hypothetical protein BBP40_006579 [Aspergillus hancockii]|nr:hypothetical protein BBP40_006579 [Aspergillus hancockii]
MASPRRKRVAVVGARTATVSGEYDKDLFTFYQDARMIRRALKDTIRAYESEPDQFQPSYPEAEIQSSIPKGLPQLAQPAKEKPGLRSPIYETLDTNAGARTMAFTHTQLPFANSETSVRKFGRGNSSRPWSTVLNYLEYLFVLYLHYISFNTAFERLEKESDKWTVTL